MWRGFCLCWLALLRGEKLRRHNGFPFKQFFSLRWFSHPHLFFYGWLYILLQGRCCFGMLICLQLLLRRYIITNAWFFYAKDVLDNPFFIEFFRFQFLWFFTFLFLRDKYFWFFNGRFFPYRLLLFLFLRFLACLRYFLYDWDFGRGLGRLSLQLRHRIRFLVNQNFVVLVNTGRFEFWWCPKATRLTDHVT